jgi:hypothetical protein
MRRAVATLCGASPHSATLLREDGLDATKWKKRRGHKRVRDPAVLLVPAKETNVVVNCSLPVG